MCGYLDKISLSTDLAAPHGLNLPELGLPGLGLGLGTGPPLLEALHAGGRAVGLGGEHDLVAGLADEVAVGRLEEAAVIQLVTVM